MHLICKEGEKKEKTIGDHLITIRRHTPKHVEEDIGRVQKGGRRLDLATGWHHARYLNDTNTTHPLARIIATFSI